MIKTILNSTLGLTSAFLLTIFLHELAHYFMSSALGYETILYHNKVFSNTNGLENDELLIAGIAPIFSLVQGLFCYNYSKSLKTSPISLFILWLGVSGIITFFGYLMIAPLIPLGDTEKVFSLLNVPMILQIIISIVAVILITFFLIKSTKHFEKYVTQDFGSIKLNRKKWSMSLILVPLILNIIIITILQFPIQHIASILATVCAPFSIMAVFGTFIGSKNDININTTGKSLNNDLSIILIVAFILLVITNRILVNGI